ncbi:MAG: putative Na+/H+ antiporter [Candidatus Methylacidiphilales bacterium]|nr:putative Na+/H+ antiporter [Candidatus Methylacidiphilales bacterium]
MIPIPRSALLIVLLWPASFLCPLATAAPTVPDGTEAPFPRPLESYQDAHLAGIGEKLLHRVKVEPFNAVATLIFLCAILHTFAASTFIRIAHRIEEKHHDALRQKATQPEAHGETTPVSFTATLFHFLGEVEAAFGLWLIPLFVAIVVFFDWNHVLQYVDRANFAEPVFVVVIMAIAATRPVIRLASSWAAQVARLGGQSVGAWWLAICTLLPVLGSFITEPAAMTIAATLLGVKFCHLKPSPRLMYATLGTLFVAVSVGGTLTHFAAPPVLMVAGKWDLNTPLMLVHYGWKAVAGIITTNAIVYLCFRREFSRLQSKADELATRQPATTETPIPVWVTGVHLAALAWTVATLHHPPFVIGGFLFFTAFTIATAHHQFQVALRGPVMVGFFLAGLVLHGGFQGWWISPLLGGLGEFTLFAAATILTSFNDNAAITYLASFVPELNTHLAADPQRALALQYAVLTGAVTGGGLTVIANAPNPAGQSILAKYFPDGISPLGLFLGALGPTLIVASFFLFFKTI